MKYISASQINMYLRCPAQYMFRYKDGIVVPPRSVLTKGKAVHKGQEVNYKQKIESHIDLPIDDIKDATATEFESLATDTEFTKDEDKGKIKDDAVVLSTLYHKEIAPKVQPLFVEEEVNFKAPNGLTIKGFIDVVQDGGIIRDTKTSAKTPPQDDADKSLQLTAYALAYRTLMGKEEGGLVLDYLINLKTPKVEFRETKRTKEDIDRFVSITSHVANAIDKGVFYPNPNNFMCSQTHCGYWDDCLKRFK